MAAQILVIGGGNDYRRDDGAGLAVARALAGQLPAGVALALLSGEATALMHAWGDADCVVLIDAVAAHGTPGAIYRLDASATPLPAALFARSTHDAGVATAIELARALGQLPSRMIIFGVEGREFGDGAGLSPPVAQAVPEVARRVLAELAALRHVTP